MIKWPGSAAIRAYWLGSGPDPCGAGRGPPRCAAVPAGWVTPSAGCAERRRTSRPVRHDCAASRHTSFVIGRRVGRRGRLSAVWRQPCRSPAAAVGFQPARRVAAGPADSDTTMLVWARRWSATSWSSGCGYCGSGVAHRRRSPVLCLGPLVVQGHARDAKSRPRFAGVSAVFATRAEFTVVFSVVIRWMASSVHSASRSRTWPSSSPMRVRWARISAWAVLRASSAFSARSRQVASRPSSSAGVRPARKG
jgi:hypothetical protein